MSHGGFFEQKRSSPAGLAGVVALHAAVLGALVLVKGPTFIVDPPGTTTIYDVPLKEPPPIPEPPPRPEVDRPLPPLRETVIDAPPPKVDPPVRSGPTSEWRPPPPLPGDAETGTPSGTGTVAEPAQPPPPAPVRREADWDPRYRSAIQPPYPPSQERLQREGQVRVRVTIGADGRVRRVERLSATNDDFWQVTERHALNRWRFRPATLDGRPVESSKVLTLTFRLEDA